MDENFLPEGHVKLFLPNLCNKMIFKKTIKNEKKTLGIND